MPDTIGFCTSDLQRISSIGGRLRQTVRDGEQLLRVLLVQGAQRLAIAARRAARQSPLPSRGDHAMSPKTVGGILESPAHDQGLPQPANPRCVVTGLKSARAAARARTCLVPAELSRDSLHGESLSCCRSLAPELRARPRGPEPPSPATRRPGLDLRLYILYPARGQNLLRVRRAFMEGGSSWRECPTR